MQRPILTEIPINDRTYQIRLGYDGKFEVFIIDDEGKHAVHQSAHDTIENAITAIVELAKRRGKV